MYGNIEVLGERTGEGRRLGIRSGLEERFYDPDHPIDSDWLMDFEAGSLFPAEGERGRWGRRRLIVNEAMIEEALKYMDERGLAHRYRPRLMMLHGHIYAVRPDGDAIKLVHSLYWEKDSGFEDLIEDQLRVMASEQRTAENLDSVR